MVSIRSTFGLAAGSLFFMTSGTLAQQSSSVDSSTAAECQSAAIQLLTGVPVPSAELIDAMGSFVATATVTGSDAACALQTGLPESLRDDYSSWDSSLSSWYSEQSSVIESIATACVTDSQAAASITQLLDTLASYTAGECPGSESTGGAVPKPTGGVLAGAAAAAAGFLGAMAIL